MADKEDAKKSKKSVSDEKEKKELELIDLPGIGPAVAAKLENAGILDLMSLAVASPAVVSDASGVSPAVARKAIQAAREMLDLGFQDGIEYAKKRADISHITTGSQNFNELLGGKGVESRAITEAFGAYGSGKTQLGLTLAVNVQLPSEKGGVNGKCVFIDTEGTFRPQRIKQISEAMGANPEKVLRNIFVARAFNSDHQVLLLEKIGEMIKNGEPIKLVIVDSLTAHFRAEFSGRGMLADRQQRLNKYLHNLMKLAEQHNLAIYVTNQVMSNPAQMFGDPTTAIGGNIVGHACLIGDSLIQLSDGSIKEVKNMSSDEVISTQFKRLSLDKAQSEQLFINPDVDKIYTIKTNNQINCSPLHRFFSVENFSIVEKEAKELKEGEFVAQVRKFNIEGEEQLLPNVNVKRVSSINKDDSKKIVEELKKDNMTRKEICEKIGITPRQFRRVLNQSYPTNFESLEKLNSHFSGRLQLQFEQVYNYKHKDLVMPQIMTPVLGQIFGYFIGDGNLEERGLRFRDARRGVLENYSSFFKETFNIEGRISKMSSKNCYNLDINSKEIRDLF